MKVILSQGVRRIVRSQRDAMPDSVEPIAFLVSDVARVLRQRFEKALEVEGLGLTPGEARVLHMVGKFPGSRQNSLAERLSVEPMTMCGYLDRLEAAGFVTRTPDPTDRRARLVRPTERSTPLLLRIESVAQKVRRKATQALSEPQVQELRDGLESIRAALAEMEAEPV